ncbi:MAG TPA: ATP-binding protein [Haliangium sp.]|nr:ATP-binding protein [Haliangium sp.]
MTLRSKLLLAHAPLVLALVLMGLIASGVTASLGRSSENILEHNYRSALAAQRMKESLERINSGALFIVAGEGAGQSARGVEGIELHQQQFETELRVQEENITEPGEREATQRLRALWTAYQEAFARLRARPAEQARATYFGELLPIFEQVRAASDEILALNQDAMVRKSDEAERAASRFNKLVVGFTAAGCILALLVSTILTTRLLRPLGVLSQTARRLGEGDLAARARVAGSDEIARLSRELNTMADRLAQYRKSSLGELLEAQQASQAAIDSLPDPVLVLGNDGALRHVNLAAESLLKVDLDRGDREALFGLDPAVREVVERVRQHVVGGKGAYAPRSLEEAFRLSTPDGDRYLLPRATPVYAEGGAVAGTTIVLQDVTRLQRFDELKNDLVATVAHEFRTPLTSLQMAIHLCVEQLVGPLTEKQAELLYTAREDCDRLQSILDELLDLSRIQAGRVELHREPLEIEAVVERALDAHRHVAAERGVELRSEVLPGTGHVLADGERLQLVLSNLLTNAIRHSPEQGTVSVRASASADRARFEVTDQGAGIPREYHQAIFDKFFRMPDAPSGTAGLGLFITRELVAAHGGDIGVISEPGHGSTFWFTLPLALDGAEQVASTA